MEEVEIQIGRDVAESELLRHLIEGENKLDLIILKGLRKIYQALGLHPEVVEVPNGLLLIVADSCH